MNCVGASRTSVQRVSPSIEAKACAIASTVAAMYAEKLTAGRITIEELVRRSFDFLLEREPNTSILRRFDLSVIARYFPEYERTIGQDIQ